MDYSPRYGRFRALLRKIREEAGLNQAALAAKLGKPQTYVSKVELGERRLDFLETMDFCAACNQPYDNLARRLAELGELRIEAPKEPDKPVTRKKRQPPRRMDDEGRLVKPQEIAVLQKETTTVHPNLDRRFWCNQLDKYPHETFLNADATWYPETERYDSNDNITIYQKSVMAARHAFSDNKFLDELMPKEMQLVTLIADLHRDVHISNALSLPLENIPYIRSNLADTVYTVARCPELGLNSPWSRKNKRNGDFANFSDKVNHSIH